MSVKQAISKLKSHKQLVFSLLWLMFVIVQWSTFANLLDVLYEKIIKDTGLLPMVAIIEYSLILICIFAPIMTLNIFVLMISPPTSPKIFGIDPSNSISNRLRLITFAISQGLKTIITLSALLMLLGFTGITIEGEVNTLIQRLTHEFKSLETTKLIMMQIISNMGLFSALIAVFPMAICGALTLLIHIICLSVSAFPMISVLLGIASGIFSTKK